MNMLIPRVGRFNSYISDIFKIPSLSLEDEMSLVRKLRVEGDLEAARTLVMSHMKLVVSIARGYEGYGLPLEDLVQEGTIGLMKAVKKFDPERGARLATVAISWVKYQIQEYVVRNWRLVKIATTHAQRKLFFNLRSLKKDFVPLRGEQISEIARHLNVSEKDVIEMDARFANGEITTSKCTEDSTDDYIVEQIPDESENQPENLIADSQFETMQLTKLKAALEKLDQRSRLILEERYLHENEKSKTLHELAAVLDISYERVRQLEVAALKKLKTLMSN